MAHRHDHSEHDGHVHAFPNNNAAFALGVVLNLGFVVAEFGFGWAAHSLALLSDAGHNLSDVFGLLLAWGADYLSKSPPTKHRTYGWRRSSILAALANALILLIAVGGISWEAFHRLARPEPVAGATLIWVAGAGVVINTLSALLFLAGRKRDLNLRGAFLHMAADAAISLGVVVTGLTILATDWNWLDPAVSLAIALLIVIGTWGLLREAVNLSLDAVPAHIDPHAVESYLSGLPDVCSLHDLHIWAMSTTEVALTAHLVMQVPPSDDAFLHQLTHELQERFGIGHMTIQIEFGATCHQSPDDVV